jgi:topoisomerase-4 subunit A
VDEFIAIKSYKAKGKRISNRQVKMVEELEPTRIPEPAPEPQEAMNVEIGEENGDTPVSDADLRDEITGQMKLFD